MKETLQVTYFSLEPDPETGIIFSCRCSSRSREEVYTLFLSAGNTVNWYLEMYDCYGNISRINTLSVPKAVHDLYIKEVREYE